MTTKIDPMMSQQEIQLLETKVGTNRIVGTVASVVSLGVALAAGTLFPPVGALMGAAGLGVAANYLSRFIQEKRRLDEEKKKLQEELAQPSHKASGT